ncbi:MAG: cupin domain-containing protein [Paracoccaceae bacterium]
MSNNKIEIIQMINMDFAERVVIDTQSQPWQDSPSKGVWRIPLAREAAERGHATSIVRYDPGTSFAPHAHPGGEEIMVLEGVFSDENGDYPAGTYIRNPKGSSHAPYSEPGCTLLVKLNQFRDGDDQQITTDTSNAEWFPGHGDLRVMPLHEYNGASTALVHWPAGAHFVPHSHPGGEEIFVLSGEFVDEHGRYPAGSWIRSPHMSKHDPNVDVDTTILVKVGHLLAQVSA